MSTFYITTAIDYVNSRPHVGTAFEKIGADAMARYRRLIGNDVYFLMGNDEHSANVLTEAKRLGKDPVAYCDEMETRFRDVWRKLHLSYDHFSRTTSPNHVRAAQEIFRRIRKKGDIFKGRYAGNYCVGCEAWKKKADLQDGRCANHPNTELQWIEEDNFFFRLSNYRDELLRRLDENPSWIEPEIRRNEVRSVLEGGLEDISISRQGVEWGVPIPDEPGHVMYVWFDALINYLSGAGFPDSSAPFRKWWPANVHVIGKDITRFHCIIWPAMLLAAGVKPAHQVFAHGFVYLKEGKMSKSEGRAVDPADLADKYGGDALRYFLLREIAFDNDGEFSWKKFFQRYNSDLANDLGNLLHRTLHMIHRYLGGTLRGEPKQLPQDAKLQSKIMELPDKIAGYMGQWRFHMALAEIWEGIRGVNTYLELTAPWTRNKEGKKEEVAAALRNAAEALRILAIHLSPFLPASADRIWQQLGLDGSPTTSLLDPARTWKYIKDGTSVQKGKPLFPRIEETDGEA